MSQVFNNRQLPDYVIAKSGLWKELFMGLFDKFKKKNNGLTIEEIISNDYEQEYFEECKYIWKNYVPSRGQANSLQEAE